MQYDVVFSTESLSDFIGKVNAKIVEGWVCTGGVCTTSHLWEAIDPDQHSIIYTQAMIKQ